MFMFEYTDTFGGEANYSWVKREDVDLPANTTNRALVRAAKKWAGLTGVRCDVGDAGGAIAIYPRGMATVLLVTYLCHYD